MGEDVSDERGAGGGAKPTIHRGLAALCRTGFARRDERGRYSLGDAFLRLAFTHHEQHPGHLRTQPILAVLDSRDAVYRRTRRMSRESAASHWPLWRGPGTVPSGTVDRLPEIRAMVADQP